MVGIADFLTLNFIASFFLTRLFYRLFLQVFLQYTVVQVVISIHDESVCTFLVTDSPKVKFVLLETSSCIWLGLAPRVSGYRECG